MIDASGLAARVARNPAALAAARGLLGDRVWKLNAGDGDVLWGRCQGSAAAPYELMIDLRPVLVDAPPRFRCSCPSKPPPCKHALALLMRLEAGLVPGPLARPEAVARFASEGERAEVRPAEAPTSVPRQRGVVADPVAQAKRAAQRRANVDAGATELGRLLDDLARRGLAEAHREPWERWRQVGARMIDAQARGLSRGAVGLGAALSGPDWPVRGLAAAGRLRLLLDGWDRIDVLAVEEPGLADEIRSLIGFETAKELVRSTAGDGDVWDVLAQHRSDDGAMVTIRTWLLGRTIGGWALVLDHGPTVAPPHPSYRVGDVVAGTAHRYPGTTRLRCVLAVDQSDVATTRPDPEAVAAALAFAAATAVDAAGVLETDAALVARSPWHDATPVVVGPVAAVPVMDVVEDRLGVAARTPQGAVGVRLVDVSGTCIPVAGVPLDLIGAGRGRLIHVVGEWDGETLLALSAIVDGALVGLDSGAWHGHRQRPNGGPFAALASIGSLAVVGSERKAGAIATLAQSSRVDEPVVGAIDIEIGEVIRAAVAPPDPPERRLLRAGGVAAIAARVGQHPDPVTEPVPAAAVRPVLGPPSAPATAALKRFVEAAPTEPAARALVETWLEAAAAGGVRPPDQVVPALMELAMVRPSGVVEHLGDLGPWLAPLVPRWARLFGDSEHERAVIPEGMLVEDWWPTAASTARVAVLRRLRSDPDAAVRQRAALLAGLTWASDTSADRRAMIDLLADDPSGAVADEQLLEAALDDRHRDVRAGAMRGLRTRPESRLAQRMAARLADVVAVATGHPAQGGRLDLVTGAQTPDWKRDGIELAARSTPEERPASVLRQLVAACPLDVWTPTGLDPAGIVLHDALARLEGAATGAAAPVALGWARASVEQRRGDWATLLVGWGWLATAARLPLLDVIGPGERASVVAGILDRDRRDDAAAGLPLALAVGAPWPQSLVSAVVASVAQAFANDAEAPRRYESRGSPSRHPVLYEALLAAASRVAVADVPSVLDVVEAAGAVAGPFSSSFEPAATLLSRRAAVAALFEPDAGRLPRDG